MVKRLKIGKSASIPLLAEKRRGTFNDYKPRKRYSLVRFVLKYNNKYPERDGINDLSFGQVKGESRYNPGKQKEIKDRVKHSVR